jgi:hypothetical protein
MPYSLNADSWFLYLAQNQAFPDYMESSFRYWPSLPYLFAHFYRIAEPGVPKLSFDFEFIKLADRRSVNCPLCLIFLLISIK